MTYHRVVLAADRVGRALGAAGDANDGDGRAVDAEEDGEVREDDAQQAQEETARSGARLWGAGSASRKRMRFQGALTLSTESQHWISPVSHSLAVVTVAAGAVAVTVTVTGGGLLGMAAARTERDKRK